MAGSTGVLIPPKGYLQKLREICTKHGILLIFDEVITGFGRLGASFATEYFGVLPDMITCAKGLTNGTIPMGAVFVAQGHLRHLHGAGAGAADRAVPRLHLLRAIPWPAPPAVASLDIYQEEGLFERANALAGYWEDAIHSLKGAPPRHRHPQPRPHRGAIELELAFPARSASAPSTPS